MISFAHVVDLEGNCFGHTTLQVTTLSWLLVSLKGHCHTIVTDVCDDVHIEHTEAKKYNVWFQKVSITPSTDSLPCRHSLSFITPKNICVGGILQGRSLEIPGEGGLNFGC